MSGTKWKNEHVYLAFDKLIQSIENWLPGKAPTAARREERVIRERLVQRVVELSFYSFCFECTQAYKKGKGPFDWIKGRLPLGGLVIHPDTGRTGISVRLFMQSAVIYLKEWADVLGAIAAGFFQRHWVTGTVTLVFGISYDAFVFGGSDRDFARFCKHGPITLLAESGQLIVQAPENKKSEQGFIYYAQKPVLELIRTVALSRTARLKLLLSHLLGPLSWLLAVSRFPVMAILSKDLASTAAVDFIDRNGFVKAVMITNSDFFLQPLWMRRNKHRGFSTHEVHYSQNTLPFVYKEDPFVAYFPPFRHVKVDEHWVWTDGYKQHLRVLGHQGPIHVIGPVVWYLPDTGADESDGPLTVVIFDITPVYDSVAEKMGIIGYYYNTGMMITFIEDILSVCNEIGQATGKHIRILLKSKRAAKKGLHDQRYIDLLVELEKQGGLEIIDHGENIFSLLKRCDVSVSIPYTTVPYISAYSKKPAVYFDPGNELLFTNEPSPYIQTASGREELKRRLEDILS